VVGARSWMSSHRLETPRKIGVIIRSAWRAAGHIPAWRLHDAAVSMRDETALDSAHLSRYDALLSTSKTLATHRTIGELFRVLGDQLHPIVPFDYLALLLHDDQRAELRLVVLEPADLALPFESKPIADHGPAARGWGAQQGAGIPIPERGALHVSLAFLRDQGWRMTCCLPLTTAHRRVGVLVFGSRSASAYSPPTPPFLGAGAANR